MQGEEFRFPFLTPAPLINHNQGFFKTLQMQMFPRMKFVTMSTAIILINIFIFVLIHILFKPGNYTSFLKWPSEMDKWLLEVEQVKTNPAYIYQAFTAMFMHDNYLHIMGNTIFSLFVMYEMESSWKWSIPLGILGGFVANCLAVLTLEGRILGFSGVLCAYVGMIVILLLTHISYIEQRYPGSMCMMVMLIAMLTFAIIGIGSSLLVHLYGYVMGIILGLGFYPKLVPYWNAQPCNNIAKVAALAICVLIIALAILL